jgi:hypothetical protein
MAASGRKLPGGPFVGTSASPACALKSGQAVIGQLKSKSGRTAERIVAIQRRRAAYPNWTCERRPQRAALNRAGFVGGFNS